MMRKYVFLDNWALSKLTGGDNGSRFIAFLKSNNYTGLVTSLSMVELYNPGWEAVPDKDRMAKVVDFLSKIPCVIVDPHKVFRAEIELYPDLLASLPIELDLQDIPEDQRAKTLLQFLRRDSTFLSQGKDIKIWRDNYEQLKGEWLQDAKDIVDYACNTGTLKRNTKGGFSDLEENRELFLLTLDLRHTESEEEKDRLLARIVAHKRNDHRSNLLAIRMTSLCFWYSYIDIDPSNIPSHKPSDIGDYYHIGLIPYCTAFTIDKPMVKLLQQIREQYLLENCEMFTEASLISRLAHYNSKS